MTRSKGKDCNDLYPKLVGEENMSRKIKTIIKYNKNYPTEMISAEKTISNNQKRIGSSVQEAKNEIANFIKSLPKNGTTNNIHMMKNNNLAYEINNNCSKFSNLFCWRMTQKNINNKKDYVDPMLKSTYILGMFQLTMKIII